MLTDLTIKNFAIIDQVHTQFGPGLNALTGETGAGKSILVDAINLLLGSRASSEMIRTGQEEASVEAFIELEAGKELSLLKNLGLEKSEGLQIRRILHPSGKSRAFLNGTAITLHMLEELGEEMIHIYGQHEHQHFLDPLRHIDILDGSGGLLDLRNQFQEVFARWTKAASELEDLISRQKQRSERMEFLAFQSGEIGRAHLKIGEDEELAAERSRLAHAEKLQSLAHFGAEVLYGESGSVVERLKATLQRLKEGARVDPGLSPLVASVESILFQSEDVASSLRSYGEKIFFDPKRLETIESRLDELSKLKKKYGPTLTDVLAHKEKIDGERKNLGSLEERISHLEKAVSEEHTRALTIARQLSRRRKEAASDLASKLEKELSTLGMKKVRFQIQVASEAGKEGEGGPAGPRLHEKGMDQVEFLLSPNPGEDLKPLARIASGGELSRIMLAMKRIFAEETLVKTLIFDEVDAGIGGGIAEIVGRKLKEISRHHQVFCITHLPQIACFADTHYKVTKKESGGRTYVEVQRLSEEERLEEVARMLGGLKITGKTIDHAKEMLKSAQKI
jgi:DNA repair protein RecN (Recombination protein N)